ncbi:hypothetical protein LAZ67_7001756 [Cordylochernes scorpioides]|uniref:RNA-directed DNA polymerase n=1 Tax=Cordylochernes scorpioides TaxID=51811 RepID=A0ABY6KN29_9ARAC|nr:hypothetical protein LAZ67_7001756 [Cordylochernes scorpioides]
MTQIQPPETFDFSTPNEWPKWRKRFERYLVVSGMKKKEEADKIDLFMYLMGDRADDIFRTFKFEKEEEATKIDSVLKAFDSHFCVRKNIIYERAKFNSRIQEDREPVDEFITSLYKLADSCEFEGLHEQLIRDRIVVGVRDKALSERMQLDSELTLEKAVKMVRQQEAVRQQQVDLQRPSTSQKVNQVKFNSKKQSPKQQQQPSRKKEKSAKTRSRCPKCGGFNHREGQACRAEGQRCNLCSKTGHFANCCPDKQAKTAEVKAVSELDEEIGFLLEVSAVEDSSNLDDDERECRRRWTAEIQVNGKKVKFKLDSQADVTCVPLCLFKKIMGQQRLVKSDINLRAAEFSELQTVGMFISTLRNGNYEIKEKIYVIRRLSEPLLSRRACELLNLARRIEVVATRINPIKDEMLTKIFEAQQEDTTLKAVVNYLEQGWPDKKMSQALLSYWHVKDELGVQNGLLMRSCRFVIPASMKLEILDKLHAGHFGITKTRLRARETVWWPGISEEIAETVRKCSVCIQEAVSKHEPLIPTNFPTRPWQKIGMDLFKFENKWYLVVIDYYSRFPEVVQLDRLTASVVVRNCKSIFARHGIPETVVSDNGTQFGAAREFANFARQYGFTHVTSSPRFPQSNGMAEAGVKIAKLNLKKNQDPSLGLLEYRSTPLENGYSPAELLMGRKLRTTLPIAPENLNPKLVDSQTLKRKEGRRRKDMKSRYDRRCGATDMEELSEGDTVWITDMRTWGIVKQKASTPRSYMVDTPVGTLRRNRFHLRKGVAVQYPADPSTPTFSGEELVENEKTPVVDYPSNDSEDGQIRTRSGRIVKPSLIRIKIMEISPGTSKTKGNDKPRKNKLATSGKKLTTNEATRHTLATVILELTAALQGPRSTQLEAVFRSATLGTADARTAGTCPNNLTSTEESPPAMPYHAKSPDPVQQIFQASHTKPKTPQWRLFETKVGNPPNDTIKLTLDLYLTQDLPCTFLIEPDAEFIPDHARLRTPLVNLLKKDVVWVWDDKCQKAFTNLKENLTTHPTLHLYQEGLPCQVYCNTSTFSITGVLKQVYPDEKTYTVQHFSRSLRSHERNYSDLELQCLAIVESVDNFRTCLMDRKFTIFSDHPALQWLKEIKAPSGRLFRWRLRLSRYEYEVRSINGVQQYETGIGTRIPFCGFLDAPLIQSQQSSPPGKSRVTIDHNKLRTVSRKGVLKTIVPSSLTTRLLKSVHTQHHHPNISKMTRLISAQYYWQNMTQDIAKQVKTCHTCRFARRIDEYNQPSRKNTDTGTKAKQNSYIKHSVHTTQTMPKLPHPRQRNDHTSQPKPITADISLIKPLTIKQENCKPDNQLNHITPLPKDIKQENCEPTNHSNFTIIRGRDRTSLVTAELILAKMHSILPDKTGRIQATLLHCLGPQVQRIFFNLPEEKDTYEKAKEALTKYFTPQKNIVSERFKFRQRKQNTDENIDSYVIALRELVKSCEFGNLEEDMIRDQIIEKCYNRQLKEKLLQQDNLNLQRTIEISRMFETAKEEFRVLTNEDMTSINRVNYKNNFQAANESTVKGPKAHNVCHQKGSSSKVSAPNLEECYRCGLTTHPPYKCGARNMKCTFYNKMGHLNRVCRNKNKYKNIEGKKRNIQNISENNEDSDEYTFFLGSDIKESIYIDGKEITMTIDTGSDTTFIGLEIFKNIFPKSQMPTLNGTERKFYAYGQTSPLPCCGYFFADVSWGERSIKEQIFVIEGKAEPLLGKKASFELDIIKRGTKIRNIQQEVIPKDIYNLIQENMNLFQGQGNVKGYSQKITLKENVTPVAQRCRHFPYKMVEAINQELDKMIENGIIEEVHEASEWISLWQFQKRGAKVFAKLDAKKGFWQIELDEKSRPLTTFITPRGCYRFCKIPFGLCSAPEAFQKAMNSILSHLERVLCYIDDVIVYAQSIEQLDQRLKKVFERFQQVGLKLNKSKCKFALNELEILGHIVSKDGIRPDPKKIESVLSFSKPENVDSLKSFLGTCGFLRKFIPDFSKLAEPLNNLTRKDIKWKWSKKEEDSFRKLKEALTKNPCLAYFDMNAPTEVIADASPHFNDYLWGNKFVLKTDHKPLIYMLNPKKATVLPPIIERLSWRLQPYDYEIEYLKGKQNIADIFSRKPLTNISCENIVDDYVERVLSIFSEEMKAISLNDIKKQSEADPFFKFLTKIIKTGNWPYQIDDDELKRPKAHNVCHQKGSSSKVFLKYICNILEELSVYDNLILKGKRIVIPTDLRRNILDLAHETHQGIARTKQILREKYYWPNMDKDIERRIKNCYICEVNQPLRHDQPLTTIPIPPRPWEIRNKLNDINDNDSLMDKEVMEHNQAYKERMKKYADSKNKALPHDFKKGNIVYVANTEMKSKLTPNYDNQRFIILETISPNSFKLVNTETGSFIIRNAKHLRHANVLQDFNKGIDLNTTLIKTPEIRMELPSTSRYLPEQEATLEDIVPEEQIAISDMDCLYPNESPNENENKTVITRSGRQIHVPSRFKDMIRY